ncbi:MAG TPA: hypothetical protein VH349_18480 [Ktedonobacterales bacterium]
MAQTHRRLSAAQRRTLEALAVDGARIVPHTSAIWPAKMGPHILAQVRWATIETLLRDGLIAHADGGGAYRITDVGRAALAEADGAKASETA